MRSGALFLGGLLAWMLSSTAPAGAEALDRHPSVLAGEAALDKRVTYTETKIPLGELVQKVAVETGVNLTAATDVADEPVAVVVKAMPARELLEEMADLLDYRWGRHSLAPDGTERDGARGPVAWRYEIWQDLASKQRQEALRQAGWPEAEKQLREGVARLIELAGLPEEQIHQILDDKERHERELEKLPPAQRAAIQNSPEERERYRRFGDAVYLWSPISRAVGRLLGRLTPEQWAALVQGQPLILSTDPKPGELPLPDETARSLRASPLHYMPPWAPPRDKYGSDDAETFRQNESKAREEWTHASGYQVAIYADLDASKPGLSYGLTAYATPLRDGVPISSFWGADATGVQVDVNGVGRFARHRPAEREPQRQVQLRQDPIFGTPKRFRPTAEPHESRGEWEPPGGLWYLEELLPDLARTYGIDLIADSYWDSNVISHERGSPTEPVALFALLDRFAGPVHQWDHRGKLIRLRRRDWYFARPREVPLRFVRRWQALCDRDGVLPLQEQMAMLQSLSKDQWDEWGGLRFLAYQTGFPEDFCGSRTALRLLAALTPDQQQALWSGKTLRMAEMTPVQRALFLTPFNHGQQYTLRVRLTPSRPPDESAAGLSVRRERLLLIRERRGRSTTYRTEPAPVAGPRASPGAAGGQARTRMPARSAASGAAQGSRREGVRAGSQPPAPSAEPVSVTRYPVTRLEFRFQWSSDSEHRDSRSLTIPSPP